MTFTTRSDGGAAGAPPRRARRRRPTRTTILVVALALTCGLVAVLLTLPKRPPELSLFGDNPPAAEPADDPRPVELGVRFTSSVAGTVTGVRFFRSDGDDGPHVGRLWSSEGVKLAEATFDGDGDPGWQTASFDTPVEIEAGKTYTASYVAPAGRYMTSTRFFGGGYTQGVLSVPAGGGVFTYSPGEQPSQTYQDSNYFVDVSFRGDGDPVPAAALTSPTPQGVPGPATAPAPTTPGDTGSDTILDLPRIPWEGGPAFWGQFAKAKAAGWTDPSFFPVVAWFNGISNGDEVAYDKAVGINTYIGMWEGTPYRIFEDNGVFWAGGRLNETFTDDSRNWVGVFLDDEVDGRYPPAEGRALLAERAREFSGQGRFTYANYTQMVMSRDMAPSDAQSYVNDFTDVVSLDMYWYTIPYCSLTPYRDTYLVPIEQKYCRTASSYGRSVSSLRERDAADGKLQPLWQWVELVNGGPGEGPFVAVITPDQLRGAVMNSIIHEARGIAYFNQSHTGPCQGGALIRQSQVTPGFCGEDQVAAAKQVNEQIRQLAPVINTQSYAYDFGPGLDTMLKARDGSAYIFAMVDGSSDPGRRSFELPPQVSGRTVEVLFENRTITASPDGSFTDTFADETSYHIYKVAK